ncbi:MAG: FeoA family protein [Verrucomicrobiaceae bacterium]
MPYEEFQSEKGVAHRIGFGKAFVLRHVLNSLRIINVMPPPLALSDLRQGQSGLIAFIPAGRPSLTRLREMGLVPGTRVTVVRRAPLGEPIEISLRGSRVAMRNHEAAHIQLSPAE